MPWSAPAIGNKSTINFEQYLVNQNSVEKLLLERHIRANCWYWMLSSGLELSPLKSLLKQLLEIYPVLSNCRDEAIYLGLSHLLKNWGINKESKWSIYLVYSCCLAAAEDRWRARRGWAWSPVGTEGTGSPTRRREDGRCRIPSSVQRLGRF